MRRHRLIFTSLLVAVGAGRARAQCSPAVQRLVSDLDYSGARAATQAALKQNPADDAALHCMGAIYIAMDKPGDATGWFERAVKANDRVAAHHLWLANSLGEQAPNTSKLKLPFLARRIKSEFDRAAQLDSTSIDARHGLIQFYSRAPSVMGGSMEKAKEQAREIGRLNPMRGHIEMAALLQREKNVAEAERELIAAVAAAPDSVVASYSLAAFYQNVRRWPDAFAVYDSIMTALPGELMAHFQYGRAAALSAINTDRGEHELKLFIAQATDDIPSVTRSGAHMRLGTIYQRQGKPNLARIEYQAALSINPRNAEAKRALATLD
jgi:Tfp pilus assembly protein PilF